MQVGDGDFFWESNGSSTFPKMAEDVDAQIKQYQEVLPLTDSAVSTCTMT